MKSLEKSNNQNNQSKLKKLKDVCRDAGMTRRAVQGYENAGLIRATDRNKYGHLLYDEPTESRIRQIKLLQDASLTLREIAVTIDAPASSKKTILEHQIRTIEANIQKDRALIRKLIELIKKVD